MARAGVNVMNVTRGAVLSHSESVRRVALLIFETSLRRTAMVARASRGLPRA